MDSNVSNNNFYIHSFDIIVWPSGIFNKKQFEVTVLTNISETRSHINSNGNRVLFSLPIFVVFFLFLYPKVQEQVHLNRHSVYSSYKYTIISFRSSTGVVLVGCILCIGISRCTRSGVNWGFIIRKLQVTL